MLVELKPVKERSASYDEIERRIKAVFRELLYEPLLRQLGMSGKALKNSRSILLAAIAEGRITFARGVFRGKFEAATSKELKALGAVWDKKTATFRLRLADMPIDLRAGISASEVRFTEKLAGIDRKLQQILPDEIADKVKVEDIFDRTLWQVDRALDDTMKGLIVKPQLTKERARRIADEWQNNLQLSIKGWTDEAILKLRKDVKKAIFAGNRHETLITTIQDSYGVTARKARFLARQETQLLVTKFKEVRYTDSGIQEYRWACVIGSKNHPVRPSHKRLEGKVFRWDDPPITTEPGQTVRRNNPGQDFNCRCAAIPIVRFKKRE